MGTIYSDEEFGRILETKAAWIYPEPENLGYYAERLAAAIRSKGCRYLWDLGDCRQLVQAANRYLEANCWASRTIHWDDAWEPGCDGLYEAVTAAAGVMYVQLDYDSWHKACPHELYDWELGGGDICINRDEVIASLDRRMFLTGETPAEAWDAYWDGRTDVHDPIYPWDLVNCFRNAISLARVWDYHEAYYICSLFGLGPSDAWEEDDGALLRSMRACFAEAAARCARNGYQEAMAEFCEQAGLGRPDWTDFARLDDQQWGTYRDDVREFLDAMRAVFDRLVAG